MVTPSGNTEETPAGVRAERNSAAAAGTTSEEDRAAQRDVWKRAQSARNAEKRRGRFRRAAKPAGAGMIRRPPPGG